MTRRNVRMSIHATLLGVGLLCCFPPPESKAQTKPSGFDEGLAENLQSILSQERFKQRLRGVSAAVMVPGQGLWQGVSGISGPSQEDVLVPDSRFAIASIKKTFAAARVMMLAEEGRLSLDDSLHRWLPPFQHIDSTITLRHLLSHTSGIYNITDHPAFWTILWANPDRSWTPKAVLDRFVASPLFTAGSRFSYSNTNYLLLNMIIKAVTDTTVSTAFRDRFWDPLNLNGTFLGSEEVVTGSIAHNWGDHDGDGRLEDLASLTGPSMHTMLWPFVFSTAGDLARWADALYGGHLLKASSLEAMMDVIPVSYNPFWTGYGLGVMRFNFDGEELWGHSGSLPGFRSIAVYWPKGRVSLSVLINQDGFESIYTIAPLLLNAVKDFLATTTPVETEEGPPSLFDLHPSYPNPFKQRTTIAYEVTNEAQVTIDVFDLYGRRIATLADGLHRAGRHQITWQPVSLASGVYLYRLQAGAYSNVRAMVLMR